MTAPLESGSSAEMAALLAVARSRLDEASRARLARSLSGDFDWDRFLRLAERHRLVPLAARHLSSLGGDVPPDVRDRLARRLRDNALRNMLLSGEMHQVVGELERRGIPVLVFKGPVLATQVYGDLALREFYDLDLLLPLDRIGAARDALAPRGYAQDVELAPAEEVHWRRTQNVCVLLREGGEYCLELHWRCFPRHFSFPIPTEALLERSVPVSVAGRAVRGLSTDDLLLVLAAHGARHEWERLEWLSGFADLVRIAPDLDWERAERTASSLGGGGILRLAVLLAHELLDAPVPVPVLERARADRDVVGLAAEVRADLGMVERPKPETWQASRFQLRLRERARDRWRYFTGVLTTPTLADWRTVHLPGFLHWLYYPVRGTRLALKYLRRVLP